LIKAAPTTGLANINLLPVFAHLISFVEILQVKYLNNLIEQDHCFIKKITNPMIGFKAFHSAKATIDEIETAHAIQKGQLTDDNMPAYKQFMAWQDNPAKLSLPSAICFYRNRTSGQNPRGQWE
jgi:putative transposase